MTEPRGEGVRRVLIVVCAVIAAADLVQPLVLSWRPKMVGAILGGVFYAACAVLFTRRVRFMTVPVMLLPLLPVTLLLLAGLGVSTGIVPDVPMVVILGLQIAAAGLALRWRSRSA